MTAAEVLAEMVRLLRADHDPRPELEALLPHADRALRAAARITEPIGTPVVVHGPTRLRAGIPTRRLQAVDLP